MKRRAPGTGTVTDRGNGRFLLRLVTADGQRHTRTVVAEDATAAGKKLDDLVDLLKGAGHAAVGGVTLRSWMATWLARQESAKSRSVTAYRSRIENHLEKAAFVDDLLVNIRPKDVRSLVRGLSSRLGPNTVASSLAILRGILKEAVEEELIDANPAAEIRLPKSSKRRISNVRAPLTRVEFEQLLLRPTLPLVERAMIATGAMGALRAGELHAMPLDHVEVRDGLLTLFVEFGGFGGAPTKTGKTRRVPVLSPARVILEEWLAKVPRRGVRNPEGLLFPGPAGGRRDYGHASEWVSFRLRLCGIEKAIRFHDLRHTAATALENGWFGPPMMREHVQAILGHATMQQTEHYTGGAGEAMLVAAKAYEKSTAPAGKSAATSEPAEDDASPVEDQRRIRALPEPHEIAAIQARNEPTARRTP
jgi:integrase